MVELDSTCGYKIMWKGKDTRGIVFIDRRPEVKPDILCDTRQLPFRNHAFTREYCDPPHLILERPPKKRVGYPDHPSFRNRKFNVEHQCFCMPDIIEEKYSHFKNRTEAASFMFNTNKEFLRTLAANGKLIYKLIDGDGKH